MSDSLWKWPNQGPTALTQGLDEEMFDTERFPFNETVVREAIQNSLDARLPDQNAPVEVRFRFHSAKLEARKALLDDVIEFRRMAGLPIPSMWERGVAEWLTVEDFNAKRLEGDLGKRGSDFWNYWLNFGKSNKDPKKRGGRGIGRVTFLISSQMQTVIGLLRRAWAPDSHSGGQETLFFLSTGRESSVAPALTVPPDWTSATAQAFPESRIVKYQQVRRSMAETKAATL